MSIELVMPSNPLILCCPLFLLPSILPSIRVFSNESALEFLSFLVSPWTFDPALLPLRLWVTSPQPPIPRCCILPFAMAHEPWGGAWGLAALCLTPASAPSMQGEVGGKSHSHTLSNRVALEMWVSGSVPWLGFCAPTQIEGDCSTSPARTQEGSSESLHLGDLA